MFRNIIHCIARFFSSAKTSSQSGKSGNSSDASDTSSDHHAAVCRFSRPWSATINCTVHPDVIIGVITVPVLRATAVGPLCNNSKPEQVEDTIGNAESFTSGLIRENSTDEGYDSVLDITNRRQTESLQQQSCPQSSYDRIKEKIEKIKAKRKKLHLQCLHQIEDLEISYDTVREGILKTKVQHQLTVKDLVEQMEELRKSNSKYFHEIETLKNEKNASKRAIVKLEAIVQEQGVKLQQGERIKGNKMCWTGKECNANVEMKQSKSSDLEKCRMKLHELAKKYEEMLVVKKECEIAVQQKRAKYINLRVNYERKVNELEQWKAFSTLKQHDEKRIEENYQKVMGKVVEEMTKVRQSIGTQKLDTDKPIIVQIELIGGKDMLICGRDGTSDPYCTIGIIKEEDKGMLMKATASMKDFYITREYLNQLNCQDSCVAYKTTNPTWNETFELLFTNFKSCTLAFEVWDDSKIGVVKLRDMKLVKRNMKLRNNKRIGGEGDNYMGRAFLTASMIKPEPIEWVLPLYSRNRKSEYGELRVCVKAVTM